MSRRLQGQAAYQPPSPSSTCHPLFEMTTLTVPRRVRSHRPADIALRLVLIVGLLLLPAGARFGSLTQRPLSDLQTALRQGHVQSLVLQVPPPHSVGSGAGALWSTGWWSPRHISSLRFDDTGHDDLAAIRAAIASSPRHVQLRLTAVGQSLPLDSGLNWAGLLSTLSLLMTVLLWVRQPPRAATRWAWFWLSVCLPLSVIAFLVLEPAPLWQRRASSGRWRPLLTGGWALLLGLILTATARALLPAIQGLSTWHSAN